MPDQGNFKKKSEKVVKPPKVAIKKVKKVYIVDTSLCTGCKECVPVCPTKAIVVRHGKAVIDPEKCVDCGLCAQACAFGAEREVEVKK